MVTHFGNPSDNNRPYSVSRRSFEFLSQDRYPSHVPKEHEVFTKNRNGGQFVGIGFNGLAIVDGIEMKGLTRYIKKEPLSDRGKALINSCDSDVAKASVIALAQGANAIISLDASLDSIVPCVAKAYQKDPLFREQIERSLQKYLKYRGK